MLIASLLPHRPTPQVISVEAHASRKDTAQWVSSSQDASGFDEPPPLLASAAPPAERSLSQTGLELRNGRSGSLNPALQRSLERLSYAVEEALQASGPDSYVPCFSAVCTVELRSRCLSSIEKPGIIVTVKVDEC